ncbi:hypothetical protein [[Clostridium] polysaccharolyticum]|uniref:Uncharacterized protein n=1 Tax=[Clostridium] polysaccharolyticum TaxID=29364 RepID=A0A1H9ZAW8_9FIRM|nr:hypothetical protein [[Clostridium] polysaccharolyticum]SES78761.1 hypothetical protein SAMN04487772_103105 [[Clostridium] polysaccharolyticum]
MEKLEKFEIKEVSTLQLQKAIARPIIRTSGLVAQVPDYLKFDQNVLR